MFIIDTSTAVGDVRNESAETEIDLVEVGPIRVRNMGALVSRSRATGCLIGMNFFTGLDSFEIRKDRLILRHGGGPDGVDIDLGDRSAAEARAAERSGRCKSSEAADNPPLSMSALNPASCGWYEKGPDRGPCPIWS
jgi:hypothetical protein